MQNKGGIFRMAKKGILVVLSGFSGAGKGTIMKELIRKYPYFLSVSATTRKPREGEKDGIDYYFYTKEQFESMIQNDELIEWAEYVGNYYGTPKAAVEKQLADGKDVLLEIEMQGGMLVKEQFPDAALLFVTPPSFNDLEQRLTGRGTETKQQIEKRIQRATEEVSYMSSYDYLIINDELEQAVQDVHRIIQTEHLRITQNQSFIKGFEKEAKKVKGE